MKPAIIIHMGASVWTAQVRGADGAFITFNLAKMPKEKQRTFTKELVIAFRESRI